MTRHTKDLLKIVVVVLILLILISTIIVLRIKRRLPSKIEIGQKSSITTSGTNEGVRANSMFLVASPGNVQVGSSIKIAAAFYAPGKSLAGADVIVIFDPAYFSSGNATELETGIYFSSYPAKSVDNEKGIIRLTAFRGGTDPASSAHVIFSTILKAKKTGKTEIKLDYLSGSTNRSTLVEKGTSKNILSGVSNAVVEIRP